MSAETGFEIHRWPGASERNGADVILTGTGVLMEKHQNVPMDLADASLLTIAESRGMQEIITLDADFYIYRLSDGAALTVIR